MPGFAVTVEGPCRDSPAIEMNLVGNSLDSNCGIWIEIVESNPVLCTFQQFAWEIRSVGSLMATSKNLHRFRSGAGRILIPI